MTPKTLFNIILKIFGLFFLKDIIETLGQFIVAVPYLFNGNTNSFDPNQRILLFIGTTTILAYYIFIAYLLFFKTNYFIEKLKLDQGFAQNEFLFQISRSSILTIALIVIGGIILTNEVPFLCKGLYQYIQQLSIQRYGGTKPDISYTLITVVKIILALLIIGERKRIVAFAEIRQKKNSTE